MSESEFSVESVLGYDTGKALVSIQLKDTKMLVDAEKAVEMSNMLLECAHAAENDRILFEALTGKDVQLEVPQAAVIIRAMRAKRAEGFK